MATKFAITPQLWDKIHHWASFPPTGGSPGTQAAVTPPGAKHRDALWPQCMRAAIAHMICATSTLHNSCDTLATLLTDASLSPAARHVRRAPLAGHAAQGGPVPAGGAADPSLAPRRRARVAPGRPEQDAEHKSRQGVELITFPKPKLPADIEEILRMPPSQATTFPTAVANPSLDPLMNEGAISGSRINYSDTKRGRHHSIVNGGVRMRIPIERMYFSPPPVNVVYPPEVHDYNENFTRVLQTIKKRHDPTVTSVAQGVLEWKRKQKAGRIGQNIQEWLDRFYLSRIGIRALIGQHVALNTLKPHPDYVGIICTRANVHDICHEAIENARYNSLRAVVERYGVDNEDQFPPVKVIVVEGGEDITIKISDEGGGIPRSALPMIWTYLYTTMSDEGLEDTIQEGIQGHTVPMAGFGYGLPLSRLYARYFGGDLRLISMEGHGTDVYISLNKLSSSREPLP
ncbi:hypothetical protein A1Q1_01815 [Trichosporon asahii var. asahii CBS 2479]|uniref:Protein-serine/threonine kinase n=1 Tax=Trichosporon asahii var. asahii (strain ATCC 90039 / CBS 2479 / JCM 2466 / KCTC 7840 / NBRC 103889/ NCYC 2677 / UAMH 7654) TaxID=1186058 RepID=J5T4S4_TRIAS|nr:hypothetical protein A1Q1_01815 [Trichosporon asahii var. asahii CBS 2479]EJT49166.1 hypothetical protein A1Q1_01815 [Trichosporon asahii var. asahii CBS 2479]